MPSMNGQNRRYNKNPSRRKIPGVGAQTYRGQRTEIQVVAVTVNSSAALVEFNQPVILKGVPQVARQGGVLPDTASINSTNTIVELQYPGVTTPTDVNFPFEDPGIRNNVGGYVRPGQYLVEE
jgi:hypothetical protein